MVANRPTKISNFIPGVTTVNNKNPSEKQS
jgi:hypothetical protein